MFALWFACAWLYILADELECAAVDTHSNEIPSRTRRVISGRPVLGLNSDYRAVRYVVWMSSAHSCEGLSYADVKKLLEAEGKDKAFPPCAPNPQANVCAGSLMTPTLVQTACHCISRSDVGNVKDGFLKVFTLRVWEDIYDIYPGVVPVKNVKGVKAKHYISHPKCSIHNQTTRIFYDYGLIVLRNSVKASGIRYAPVYTIQGLLAIWTEMMAKNSVCLNIGFGRYRLLSNRSATIKPPEILHGWVQVVDYIECYDYSNHDVKWFNYSDATWFCTREMPTFKQSQNRGDSGGPVSCNNQYAGIVSFIVEYIKPFYAHYYSGSSSTAFSIFENAAEYRESLNNVVDEYEKYDSNAKIFNYRPTAPQINQYYYLQL